MGRHPGLALTAAVAVGTVFAAGCAHFDPKPLSPAKNADRLEGRSLTNEDLKIFVERNLHPNSPGWPNQIWDLDTLTWAAFYYSPALELAVAQWEVARGGEVTAGQRPNPVLTVSPSYNTTTLTPSPWLTIATLDVPIETAGKRRHRRQHAANLAEAARLNIAATAYKVRSDVRTALVDVIGTQSRNRLLKEQLDAQENIVSRMQQQVQAGSISSADALPMRLALARARLDMADGQRLASDARSRLAEAVGVPMQALTGIELKMDLSANVPGQEITSDAIRRQALLSRPDILNALADYAATESALRLEIAKQYPDVHLQPGYEFDQGDNKWGIGINIELPVLSHNQGPIAEARAHRQESAAKFNALQARTLAEIDRAIEQFRITETNSALLRSLAETAEERQQTAEAQFKTGAIDQTEVLTGRLEAVSARLLRLDGQVKFQQALGTLENAVQRPLELPHELAHPAETQAGKVKSNP